MAEKFRITKEGATDRMVTEEQFKAGGFEDFARAEDTTPIQAPTALPGQEAAFAFAQKAPAPMTVDTLSDATPLAVPDIGTGVDVASPEDFTGADTAAQQTVADTKAFVEQQKQIREETLTETQQEDIGLAGELKDLIPDLGGKAQFEAEQRAEKFGTLETDLGSVTNQIEALLAEKEKFRTDQEGRPMTLSRLTGSIARNNAKLNSEILMLSARANGLRGDIAVAEKQVTAAVNAKYAPIEEEIAVKQAQRLAIADLVDDDEKAQLDALEKIETEKAQEIQDQKDLEINIANVMLQAAQAGITDANVLSQIQNAKSEAEATSILAQNMPEAEVGTQVIVANGRKLLINAQTGDTIKDLGSSTTGSDSSTKIYGATNIPADIKSDLISDIEAGNGVNALYSAYPEVNTSYIDSLLETVEAGVPEAEIQVKEADDVPSSDKTGVTWWNPTTWF